MLVAKGLTVRVDPPGYVHDRDTVSLEMKIRRVVKALCDHVLTDDALREFRSKHLFNKELASGKWSSGRWFRVEEEMDGDVQPFMPLEVSIKSNEVLPARDKAPRPLIASGDRGQFMASLTIKAIEKSFSSYFADANIKNRTKHDAMQNVANRLNMRSHKGIRRFSSISPKVTVRSGIRVVTQMWGIRLRMFCLSTSPSILPRP